MAGKTGSFFDFDLMPYSNQTNVWGSNLAGGGIEVFAYTAQFGNGLSASIAAENANGHRTAISSIAFSSTSLGTPGASWQYANQQAPDVVGNLRIDQAWGSAQVMGAYHQLTANSLGASNGAEMTGDGWAFGAGAKFNLPMLGKGDYIQAQAAWSEGAVQYAGSGINGGFLLTDNKTVALAAGSTNFAGPSADAVVTGGGTSLDKTKAWSITGGYEHFWNTQWKTSLYGAYGKLRYSDAASAVLRPASAGANSTASWSYYQVGSRTTWTPVANLDLSLEAMYNHLDGAFADGTAAGTATYGNKSWVSGIFRVQRNFYP